MKLISKPINEDSIKEAEEIGPEIISESIDNQIILDLLYWDEYPDKLSKSTREWRKKFSTQCNGYKSLLRIIDDIELEKKILERNEKLKKIDE
jgi:hypothetical protein